MVIAYRRFILRREDGSTRAVVPAAAGESLFDAAQRSGQPVRTRCRGSLICGLCRVDVVEGAEHVEPPHAEELDLLRERALDQPSARLACQLRHRDGSSGAVVVCTPYW